MNEVYAPGLSWMCKTYVADLYLKKNNNNTSKLYRINWNHHQVGLTVIFRKVHPGQCVLPAVKPIKSPRAHIWLLCIVLQQLSRVSNVQNQCKQQVTSDNRLVWRWMNCVFVCVLEVWYSHCPGCYHQRSDEKVCVCLWALQPNMLHSGAACAVC